jgi:hypothetical protein
MSDEILTMSEAAAILKMTERQVYELTRRRSLERMEHPFPAFNIHAKAKRIRRSDLMAWIGVVEAWLSVDAGIHLPAVAACAFGVPSGLYLLKMS